MTATRYAMAEDEAATTRWLELTNEMRSAWQHSQATVAERKS